MEKMQKTPIKVAVNVATIVLVSISIVTAVIAIVLDKSLPYRISQSQYAQFLWAGRLTAASMIISVAALVVSIVSRQWLYMGLALLPMVFLALIIGGVHSGPNPQAWCFNNLRKIESAKEQLVLRNNLTNKTAITAEQISPYIEGGVGSLQCAEMGNYIINLIGTEPRCSVHGSISEMEAEWKTYMSAQRYHTNETSP
jgi:hypothetical protein